ncbi:hypothetical protein LRM33_15560 [Klebsiella pneumoniae]|uniref:hypothetical protein n=1 Tax=Klebsiella pneumoniae TaxID=573 RepID=UPI001F4C5641|nr:hypothetical protein [Klebsiella pneumoniae]UNE90664.1 hypothetical protein LRM33_15560 [Klebsiella pneumoniae]UNE96297.1 hypothetical protein LRM34_15550 [Klebsiella pneumoniae]WQN87246.1 hypothetical protein U8Q79_15595 [Klebsiella pneumoniae]WQN92844.1 hypothetical protein U8Q78_15590 [Klebsiella pneumoniae]
MGLAFNLGFKSTRVLSDLQLTHIQQEGMTYLGLYGDTAAESLKNRSKGALVTPVTQYQPANWRLGANYLSSAARNLSAAVQSVGQPQQLDSTIFVAFNAGETDVNPGVVTHVYVASLWGTLNPISPYQNAGRLSISLTTDIDGTRFITLKWGSGDNVPSFSCAVPFDWTTAITPIFAMGSRNSAGDLALEVRVGDVSLTATAQVSPVAIPEGTTDWRLYAGLLSNFPVTDLKVYAAAVWSTYLDPESISSEMNIMAVNLSSHLKTI